MEFLYITSFVVLCIFAIIGAATCLLFVYAVYSDEDED